LRSSIHGSRRLLEGRAHGAPDRLLDPVEEPLLAVMDAAPPVQESDYGLADEPCRRLRGAAMAHEQIQDPRTDPLQEENDVPARRVLAGGRCHGSVLVSLDKKKIP
jgi:hypothetical protein